MRKSLTLWLCVLILGTIVTAARQSGDADRSGTWTGTWEGAGQTGGFELTFQKPNTSALTGGVSVTGEPTYKATFKTVTIEGNKLNAVYDFPPAEGVEVVLAGTFDGTTCKGTWVVREKASGNAALDGTWSVTKK